MTALGWQIALGCLASIAVSLFLIVAILSRILRKL